MYYGLNRLISVYLEGHTKRFSLVSRFLGQMVLLLPFGLVGMLLNWISWGCL